MAQRGLRPWPTKFVTILWFFSYYLWKIRYDYESEPVLVKRILICFEVIREKILRSSIQIFITLNINKLLIIKLTFPRFIQLSYKCNSLHPLIKRSSHLTNDVSLLAAVNWSSSGGFKAHGTFHPLQLFSLSFPEHIHLSGIGMGIGKYIPIEDKQNYPKLLI